MSRRPPGAVVWLTGLPGAGKTTLARAVLDGLAARGVATLWLDSDDLRAVLTPAPDYGDAERERFYAALGHLARLGAAGGAVVVVSATAARRAWRDRVRASVARFVEVEVRCDPATLRARDPKGLWARADRGELPRLPGAGVPYEAPERPEVVADTAAAAPEDLARAVLAALDAAEA